MTQLCCSNGTPRSVEIGEVKMKNAANDQTAGLWVSSKSSGEDLVDLTIDKHGETEHDEKTPFLPLRKLDLAPDITHLSLLDVDGSARRRG